MKALTTTISAILLMTASMSMTAQAMEPCPQGSNIAGILNNDIVFSKKASPPFSVDTFHNDNFLNEKAPSNCTATFKNVSHDDVGEKVLVNPMKGLTAQSGGEWLLENNSDVRSIEPFGSGNFLYSGVKSMYDSVFRLYKDNREIILTCRLAPQELDPKAGVQLQAVMKKLGENYKLLEDPKKRYAEKCYHVARADETTPACLEDKAKIKELEERISTGKKMQNVLFTRFSELAQNEAKRTELARKFIVKNLFQSIECKSDSSLTPPPEGPEEFDKVKHEGQPVFKKADQGSA
jgi:hypothetical protein